MENKHFENILNFEFLEENVNPRLRLLLRIDTEGNHLVKWIYEI